MTRKLIDVSHDIEAGMITYPGLPGPEVSDHLSREGSRGKYAPGTTFQIAKIDMIANTGTYLDSPFHRFGDREDLGMLPLDAVADLAGLVIDASSRRGRSIGPEVFAGYSLSRKAVLIKTLWDRHWRTPQYGAGHPYLTRRRSIFSSQPELRWLESIRLISMIPMMERGRTHIAPRSRHSNRRASLSTGRATSNRISISLCTGKVPRRWELSSARICGGGTVISGQWPVVGVWSSSFSMLVGYSIDESKLRFELHTLTTDHRPPATFF